MTSEEIRNLAETMTKFRDEYYPNNSSVTAAPYRVHLSGTISVLTVTANRIEREENVK